MNSLQLATGLSDVLHFWFEELQPQAWFTRDAAVDNAILTRFAALHDAISQHVPEVAHSEPTAALAAIIVLDQFPRNMFRGTSRAYATDSLALSLAIGAVDNGLDKRLPDDAAGHRHQFLYMPFMHSEDLSLQQRSLALFVHVNAEGLQYAQAHQEVIAKFGRFPHRNAVLGRTSTFAELEFMKTHPGF